MTGTNTNLFKSENHGSSGYIPAFHIIMVGLPFKSCYYLSVRPYQLSLHFQIRFSTGACEELLSSCLYSPSMASLLDEFQDRPMPNVFLQFAVLLKREGILQFRYIRSLFLDMFLVLIAGGALGALYTEVL